MPTWGVEETDPMPAPSRKRRLRVFAAILWAGALLVTALVLYLSWLPSSRVSRVEWLPDWLTRWADSGGEVMTMRTGVAMALAALLFTGAWAVSKWRFAPLGGLAMAVGLLALAEGGQLLLPARSADWGDIRWGLAGAAAGTALAALARILTSRTNS
ncbi:MAG: hypothetical protein HKN82_12505 [Akkermansiaceae bacterium]|nr:hypothetical protein [Akkermansiaceae bacterium]NNM28279.1 hypothetical protein [Akkermansiaceae bacterium]